MDSEKGGPPNVSRGSGGLRPPDSDSVYSFAYKEKKIIWDIETTPLQRILSEIYLGLRIKKLQFTVKARMYKSKHTSV